ncbi:MAG TPA: c-type cytochrome [Anaerolineales bacterium]|nr:c-type cytochrome [Anaerolineales bacterium]
MDRKLIFIISILILGSLLIAACAGSEGAEGPQGPQGPAGPAGAQGPEGSSGTELTEDQLTALETAGNLAGIQFPGLDEVRRGCPACHVLVDEETGRYTLPFEAHERAEARGEEHPEVAPDGTSLAVTEEVKVTTCLQCHAAGTGDRAGKGVIAPLSLRDIVHPAHMYSQWFKLHYGGNCFTCHNVDGEGNWELLTEKVEVNEKGVPDPDSLPIPGAVPIGGAAVSGSASVGGRLYDQWWKEAGVDEPSSDQPLWATQSTNTRSGTDTWRCKECHGWDYQGAAGAYGSGSHFTGFSGVFDVQSESFDTIVAFIDGSANSDHDFSAMGDEAINNLAAFLKSSLVDVSPLIDPETKAAIGGDTANGEELYAGCAACHGDDGLLLNFGGDDDPEYVGTIAFDNPWEFLHKVRAGQPGTGMPAALDAGWSMDDLLDLLAFSQTLPTEAP